MCDACSWRCSFTGSVSVSSCRCCVFGVWCAPSCYSEYGVCVICGLLMFVSDNTCRGNHMVETYSCMDLIKDLYVASIISFCFPMLLM